MLNPRQRGCTDRVLLGEHNMALSRMDATFRRVYGLAFLLDLVPCRTPVRHEAATISRAGGDSEFGVRKI
jgi:hypothetical protein